MSKLMPFAIAAGLALIHAHPARAQETTPDQVVREMEGVFGEPTDQGMANALDQFFSSWSDLSAAPNSLPARAVVVVFL